MFGLPLEQAWQDWIAFEHEFQRRNLAEVRKFPITPQRNLVASALGSVSRTYYDEATGTLYGAFRYPGVVEHVGALNTRDGSVRQLADIKRRHALPGHVVRLRPGQRNRLLHQRQQLALRDLMAVDVKTGEDRMLIENARIGEIVFNPVDRSLMGVRHENGLATLVRIPYPYDDLVRDPHVSVRSRALRSRHLARRPTAVGVDERGQRRPVPARVGDSRRSWPGT